MATNKKPRYRIVRKGDVYRAQRRGWFFWYDLGESKYECGMTEHEWSGYVFYPFEFTSLAAAEDAIEADRKSYLPENTQWKVVKEIHA